MSISRRSGIPRCVNDAVPGDSAVGGSVLSAPRVDVGVLRNFLCHRVLLHARGWWCVRQCRTDARVRGQSHGQRAIRPCRNDAGAGPAGRVGHRGGRGERVVQGLRCERHASVLYDPGERDRFFWRPLRGHPRRQCAGDDGSGTGGVRRHPHAVGAPRQDRFIPRHVVYPALHRVGAAESHPDGGDLFRFGVADTADAAELCRRRAAADWIPDCRNPVQRRGEQDARRARRSIWPAGPERAHAVLVDRRKEYSCRADDRPPSDEPSALVHGCLRNFCHRRDPLQILARAER